MMAHALDTPAPATIILISGDRDFVYVVSILALRQYRIVVINPNASAHTRLRNQAEAVYRWPDDFLSDSSHPTSSVASGPGIPPPRGPNKNVPSILDDFGTTPASQRGSASMSGVFTLQLLPTQSPGASIPPTPPAPISPTSTPPESSMLPDKSNIPPEFKPLVKVLLQQHTLGNKRVEYLQLSTLLSEETCPLTGLYESAGVKRLRQYVKCAESHSIIHVVGDFRNGNAQIELCWPATSKK